MRISFFIIAAVLYAGVATTTYASTDASQQNKQLVLETIEVRALDSVSKNKTEVPEDVLEQKAVEVKNKEVPYEVVNDVPNVTEAIDHNASRSNTTERGMDTDIENGDTVDATDTQVKRKRPGRVTYGNVTLERSFDTSAPDMGATQSIEAAEKVFLFGFIPMQIDVTVLINKDDEIETIQRPWYSFLFFGG